MTGHGDNGLVIDADPSSLFSLRYPAREALAIPPAHFLSFTYFDYLSFPILIYSFHDILMTSVYLFFTRNEMGRMRSSAEFCGILRRIRESQRRFSFPDFVISPRDAVMTSTGNEVRRGTLKSRVGVEFHSDIVNPGDQLRSRKLQGVAGFCFQS